VDFIHYIYFRIYSWYKKKGSTTVPETCAAGILMFMFLFVGLFIVYWLVRLKYLPLPNDIAKIIFIFIPPIIVMTVEFWFKNKIDTFKKKWQNENVIIKKRKGYIITLLALTSFVGLFVIANAFYHLVLNKK
jgi:hypothetical protein